MKAVIIPLDKWVRLTEALTVTPDIEIDDLIKVARETVKSRRAHAREIVELEQKLIEKCPDLET